MICRAVIEKHLRDLTAMVAELEHHRSKSAKELQADRTVLLAVEHALQRAIQNLLNICLHILSESGVNDWEDYRGAILKVGELGIVPEEFAQTIGGMAGVRNLLVHEYIEVEVEKIVSLLENRLDDFKHFAQYIVEFLQEHP